MQAELEQLQHTYMPKHTFTHMSAHMSKQVELEGLQHEHEEVLVRMRSMTSQMDVDQSFSDLVHRRSTEVVERCV